MSSYEFWQRVYIASVAAGNSHADATQAADKAVAEILLRPDLVQEFNAVCMARAESGG